MTFQIKKYTQSFLATLCLMLLATVCPAQQPFQHKYTIDDGLPFAEVDGIQFTKNGEAWVRYSSGEVLSRFDGINWTHYRLDEMRLPLGLVFVSEDENGIWFQSGPNHERRVACLTPSGEWKKYYLEGRFSIYFTQKNNSPYFVDDQFYSYQYDAETDQFIRSEIPLYVLDTAKGESFRGIYTTDDKAPTLAIKISPENNVLLRYGKGFQYSLVAPVHNFHPAFLVGKDLRGLFSKNGQWLWWDGSKSKALEITLPNGSKGKPLHGALLNFFGSKRNLYSKTGIVVEDPATGVFYLYGIDSNGNTQLLLRQLAKDCFSDTFSQDKHGHWWYGTSSGLVRTDQSQLVFHENMPGMVTGLHAIGEDGAGNIWMGGYTGAGGFTVYDGYNLQRHSTKYPTMPVLPNTCRSTSGALYFFVETPTGIMAVKEGQLIPINIPMNERGHIVLGFYFHPLSNSQIALGLAGNGLGIATETNGLISSIKTIGKGKGMLLDNVLTVSEDQGGRLWAGRMSQGVAVYDPQRDTAVTWLRSPEMPNSVGAMATCVDENGTLWLGTNDGVYLLRNAQEFDYLKENLFGHLEKIPLPGTDDGWVNFVKNSERYIVFGTNSGVYFFDKNYHDERPRIFSMMFGKDIAGGGAEQNAVLLDSKGMLWVGTQEGATRLDLSQLQFDTSATSIKLISFQAGDSPIPVNGNDLGSLPYSKRNMRFSFAPSGNDRLKDNLFYDVFVVNADGDTLFQRLSTHQKSGFQIDHLPYGDYTLYLVAYKHNVLSGQSAYHFEVPKLWEERPIVWVLGSVLLFGTLFYFYWENSKKQKIILRYQLDAEKSKRERDGLKVQALSNFFEPHFINNSLNWIQARYRNDPETATVVGRLAENVTILYNNTQDGKTFHPLTQELVLLKNYLMVQQVRFKGDLSVHYDILEEKLLAPYSVPAMLLQIHAENAVEKGIRGGTGKGRVSIAISLSDNGCQIKIEDEGRGRPREVIENGNGRKGSTAVMDNLIALLNAYNKEPIMVKYEDHIFNNPLRGGYGTRVVIFIPKNYNYELS